MFNTLIFDDEMINFLSCCPIKKITDVLLSDSDLFINLVGNFVKKEDEKEADVISYLPKSKIIKNNNPYDKGIGRTKIKVGRFIRKFLTEKAISIYEISDQDIEQFVNFYKSYFNSNTSEIKIIEGNDILNLYLEENYYKPNDEKKGSLWNSCMRYRDRNKFMKIYSKNHNIKMAVLFEDGFVRSRALLWNDVKDDTGNNYKIMDRIYSIYDHDFLLFKKWASENGYLSKYHQNAKSGDIFDIGGLPVRKDLIVSLENHDFNYYPYLDTFKFYNRYKGTFSNSSSLFRYDYILVQSNGGLEPEPESEPEYYDDDY